MTIKGKYDRFKALDTGKIITEVMSENIEVLGEINLSQLYAGKTREGTDLSPTYLEDPYFETYAQALAYSNWKDKITTNPKRHRFVPNLIINGYYYSSRNVVVSGNRIVYDSNYLDLTTKYGKEIDGLGGEYKEEFLKQFIMPGLLVRIKNVI